MKQFNFLDYEGLKHLIEQIKLNYVQKESGKGLSSNDFTSVYMQKLESIDTGANVNAVFKVNDQVGDVILKAKDIMFLSSKGGSSEKSIAVALDALADKDQAIDDALETKANANDVYTKEEINIAMGENAGTISVNGKTGIVVLDTDDLSDAGRTNKFVTAQEKTKWDSKPGLDYVNEQLETKVDKIPGKGLSEKDFTAVLQGKLDNIAEAAQPNKIELIKRNGSNLPIGDDLSVDIRVPVGTSDLSNDAGFQTKAQVESLISEQGKMKKVVVEELPELVDADENTLYLVPNDSLTNPGFIEHMLIQGAWEILGDTAAVDFTGYVKEKNLIPITFEEINEAFSIA